MATTPVTDRPMRADARRNRGRVLKAARHCFAADGLEAQMDDVATRAKVGVGTVYRHLDRKSTRLNSSHQIISYAVFCLKKKKESVTSCSNMHAATVQI